MLSVGQDGICLGQQSIRRTNTTPEYIGNTGWIKSSVWKKVLDVTGHLWYSNSHRSRQCPQVGVLKKHSLENGPPSRQDENGTVQVERHSRLGSQQLTWPPESDRKIWSTGLCGLALFSKNKWVVLSSKL